jgi:hypothetical protein
LQQCGLRLFYNCNAIAYHWQRFSFADACRRAQRASTGYEVYRSKEAGRHDTEVAQGWRLQRARNRMRPWVARSDLPLVSILKPLLDTRIPFRMLLDYVPYRVSDVSWKLLRASRNVLRAPYARGKVTLLARFRGVIRKRVGATLGPKGVPASSDSADDDRCAQKGPL